MKKLFLIMLMLLAPIILFCQPYQSPTNLNSTIIPLDSAETWTGNIERVSSDYVSMVITIFSDVGGTLKVEWARVDTKPVQYVAYDIRTYTAGDTVGNRFFFPITLGYFRVVYTNGASNQTYFKLTTTLVKGDLTPLTPSGKIDVAFSDGATAANQTNGTQRTIPVNGANAIIGVQTSPFYTTPDYAKVTTLDSLAASGGAHADSAIYNPNGRYGAVYVDITARTGADTLTIKMKSSGFRNIWGSNAFSLEDELTRSPEVDNTTIIIAANTNRRFLISVARPEWILITRKVTNGVNKLNTVKVAFEGVNL